MKLLLKSELLAVTLAQEQLKAQDAYSRHQSLKAKQAVNQLLTSGKVLGVAFGVGVPKGLLSSSSSAKSSNQTALVRHPLSVWLASTKGGS